jgi:2-dehydro-3-deoxyglucarate aldolase
MTQIKQRLRTGAVTFGSWITLGHPGVAEVLATAGFEWLVVDLEHSVIGIEQAAELIRAIDLLGLVPFVRLTSNDAMQAKRVLDAGARGIIVPMIMNAAEAADAVAAVKYPPAGRRSVGLSRAQGYGTRFAEYATSFNDESIVVAQIEHHRAIADLDAILAVDGIDATIIGPYDLSASMGKPGRYDDPEVRGALDRYEAASKRAGKPLGFHVVEPDAVVLRDKVARGYTFIAVSVDFMFLGTACRSVMKAVKAAGVS